MYMVTGHGISIGFHRYFVHGSFKATRPMRAVLAVLGQAAIEGDVITWVADHRRHHKFSDKDGDPHSPWRFGNTIPALAKGFAYAHIGWLFHADQSPPGALRAGPAQGPDDRQDLEERSSRSRSSRCCSPRSSAASGRCHGRARLPRSSGAASSGLVCCTTSPGRSTRSATRWATVRSRAATSPATCGGLPCCRSASPGTTSTTPTQPRPATASCPARSTPALA